jgi:hypothetical protein
LLISVLWHSIVLTEPSLAVCFHLGQANDIRII